MLSNEVEELWTSVFIKRNMTALRREKYTNKDHVSYRNITFSVQRQKFYFEAYSFVFIIILVTALYLKMQLL